MTLKLCNRTSNIQLWTSAGSSEVWPLWAALYQSSSPEVPKLSALTLCCCRICLPPEYQVLCFQNFIFISKVQNKRLTFSGKSNHFVRKLLTQEVKWQRLISLSSKMPQPHFLEIPDCCTIGQGFSIWDVQTTGTGKQFCSSCWVLPPVHASSWEVGCCCSWWWLLTLSHLERPGQSKVRNEMCLRVQFSPLQWDDPPFWLAFFKSS